MTVIGVLALQGDVREHQRALQEAGVDAPAVRRPAEVAHVDGLVIPGGESTTIDKLITAFGLREPLRQRLAGGMPVYGSCAGMILLASTILDGRPDQEPLATIEMTVRRNAFGRQVDSFEADLAVAGIAGAPMRAVFIRAPWVESVGQDVRVLATVTGPDGATHPVAVRQGNALATSFHPEVTGDHRVHALFADMVRSAQTGAPS
ncbi:pyridoxal 5'-phosphate synthase glutaminase subunit PdxT [Branchiibius cervicis]|uniref:Pyridoxal 5'-phosphate synthase subunit PdxT n=1 Tax=Branchiibius cervicis TaxID=908252 RepID=A0ABW2AS57_9MICO